MKEAVTKCPITKVVELLSDKWTMLILYQLNNGSKRFCEIERSLEGISTRTLTLKLNRLMEEGVVLKIDGGLYETTKRGQGLRLIEKAMRKYEKEYL